MMDRNPWMRDIVAQGMVDGKTNQQIADDLQHGTHRDSVTDYKRHEAVLNIAERLTKERFVQITGKIDSSLLARLEHVEKIDIETLLKIRKEVLPERIEITNKNNKQSIVQELFDLADSDPELAAQIMDAQEKAAAKAD